MKFVVTARRPRRTLHLSLDGINQLCQRSEGRQVTPDTLELARLPMCKWCKEVRRKDLNLVDEWKGYR